MMEPRRADQASLWQPPDPGVREHVGPKAWLGHRVREALVHLDRVRQPMRAPDGAARPRVVFLPSRGVHFDGSALLRCQQLALALRPLGWRSVLLPAHLEWSQRVRVLRREAPDVVVVQSARHVLNRPALYRGLCPVVFDLDDADYLLPERTEQYRSACAEASMVFAGSQNLRAWCEQACPRTHVVWTGHPAFEHVRTPAPAARDASIAWAQVAWWNYPHEAALVQRVVLEVARSRGAGSPLRFGLFGVQREGDVERLVAPMRAAGVRVELFSYMPAERFIAELGRFAVGLHVLDPNHAYAQAKSFGKVLSYMAARCAIVGSNLFEPTRFFRDGTTALLCDTPEDFVSNVRTLLDEPATREAMARAAHADFLAQLSSSAVAVRVDTLLRELITSSPKSTRPPTETR